MPMCAAFILATNSAYDAFLVSARALQIHATCVAIGEKGVLLLGPSGAGKSETALRLLDFPDTKLVADDRVDLVRVTPSSQDKPILEAKAPPKLQGLLEVRHVGILKLPFADKIAIALCVHLFHSKKTQPDDFLRLPPVTTQIFLDQAVRCLTLPAWEAATPSKIRAALLYETVTDAL